MNIPFKKKTLVLLFPVLLTACAGGGGFETNVVPDNKPTFSERKDIKNNIPSVDEPSQGQDTKESYLGYQVDIPRRNTATHYENGEQTEGTEDEYRRNNISLGQGEWVKVNKQVETNLLLENKKERIAKDFHLTDDDKKYGFKHISLGFEDYNELGEPEEKGPKGKEYILRTGPTGHLYYQGEKAAKAIPVGGNVVYKGIWHFVTDAERNRFVFRFPIFDLRSVTDGENNGATSNRDGGVYYEWGHSTGKPLGYASEFNVNFDEKTLEGKLTRTPRSNDKKVNTLYEINATIKNNRFSGIAKATPNNINEKAYFNSDSKSVEGGFYGDNAEELAGSFLADDKTIFVVFGAKSENPNLDTRKIVEAFSINVESGEDFLKSDLETFHNISKLIVDGKEIPLGHNQTKSVTLPSGDKVEVTAIKLGYTSFGDFNYTGESFESLKQAEIDSKKAAKTQQENREKELVGEIIAGYFDCYGVCDYSDLGTEISNRRLSKTNILKLLEENNNKEVESEELNEIKAFIQKFEPKINTNSDIDEKNKPYITKYGKHFFVQGILTKDMPQSSIVKYKGNWEGRFEKDGISPLHLGTENKAEFSVNFADKSLEGKLIRNRDEANQYIEIYDGKVNNNTFTGKARTGEYGIYFDTENTHGNKKIQFNEATVEGGFYGPNAQELGGGLHYNTPADKAAAVFGAKQVKDSK